MDRQIFIHAITGMVGGASEERSSLSFLIQRSDTLEILYLATNSTELNENATLLAHTLFIRKGGLNIEGLCRQRAKFLTRYKRDSSRAVDLYMQKINKDLPAYDTFRSTDNEVVKKQFKSFTTILDLDYVYQEKMVSNQIFSGLFSTDKTTREMFVRTYIKELIGEGVI